MKKTVLTFDLDGTLYSLLNKTGEICGYSGSILENMVQANAREMILNRKLCNEQTIEAFMRKANLDPIGVSQYLLNNFGISREDYFAEVWDINPEKLVLFDQRLKLLLAELKQKNTLILLTSAPRVWQQKIFEYLNLDNIFTKIYTGDTFKTKTDIFKKIKSKYPTQNLISFGDQLETDIEPAKKLGYQACLVKNSQDIINFFSPSLPYYIDTDMGNDDILAISLMIKNKLNICGISTVFGVATANQGAKNISRILDYIKQDIPIYQGKSNALNREWNVGFPSIDCQRANNLTLLTKLPLPNTKIKTFKKLDEMAKNIIAQPYLVNLVALGPLTNLATIINKYGSVFTDKIAMLTIMGGSINVKGIVPPDKVAEYNMYLDPQAANRVFSTPNIAITLVPLDATRYAPACEKNAARQKLKTQYKAFMNVIKIQKSTNKIAKIISLMITQNSGDFDSFYDPVAVATIIQPELIEKAVKGKITILTTGKNIGQTKMQTRYKSQTSVVTKINTKDFYKLLIRSLNT